MADDDREPDADGDETGADPVPRVPDAGAAPDRGGDAPAPSDPGDAAGPDLTDLGGPTDDDREPDVAGPTVPGDGDTAGLPTTEGRYRVLPATDDGEGRVLVSLADYEPTTVRADETTAGLEPGDVVAATVAWDEPGPRLVEATRLRRDRYSFVDGVTDLFEAARETFEESRRAGDGVGSRVTYTTDGEANGVVYTFADPPDQDRFAEFREGRRPIEPLVERVNEGRGDGSRAVFVLRPVALDCVVVLVAFDPDGLLARTVADTYC
jgi:hypothetical protein